MSSKKRGNIRERGGGNAGGGDGNRKRRVLGRLDQTNIKNFYLEETDFLFYDYLYPLFLALVGINR